MGPTAGAPFPRSRVPQHWLETSTPTSHTLLLGWKLWPLQDTSLSSLLPATMEQEQEGLGAPERLLDTMSKTLPWDQFI